MTIVGFIILSAALHFAIKRNRPSASTTATSPLGLGNLGVHER